MRHLQAHNFLPSHDTGRWTPISRGIPDQFAALAMPYLNVGYGGFGGLVIQYDGPDASRVLDRRIPYV